MSPSSRLPTLLDVATAAGVSLATASRALNGSTRTVNGDYRDRVFTAAAQLGYTPNLSAQAVATGSTRTVALVVTDIADPRDAFLASGVIDAAADAGLTVTVTVTAGDPDRELALVRSLRGQRPRILILAGPPFPDGADGTPLTDELRSFEAGGGRVIVLGERSLGFATVPRGEIGSEAGPESLAAVGRAAVARALVPPVPGPGTPAGTVAS
ncbi:LacI family DNA-binding transcriptional regulator [Cryobacterium sp. RTC2.1]|uniref:LacI family DNA-binding transcriptional regulator n=1 Tax=Cryobacterium sp. RTC2.1 TaxID=3048634 RepID=UPI002B227D59|nr:LacI family DNA-binding transcriptional regulator [Cryobacterium sp. RTC2.1]MEB0003199.1 LacI family DNA-binding transcriptional regulator [Cryobacterium sp. RTC2.1]